MHPAFPANVRPQTDALRRAATGTVSESDTSVSYVFFVLTHVIVPDTFQTKGLLLRLSY